jgi:uncharacterized Zn finger protein (UPF0148 family)
MNDFVLKEQSKVCWGCGRPLIESGGGYLTCPPCDSTTVTISDNGSWKEMSLEDDFTTTGV